MDHDRARSMFTCYHDGDLASDDRKALEEHLSACADCQREWEAYRRTVGGVAGLPALRAPDDFVGQVERRIARRSRGRFFGDTSSLSVRFALISLILIFVILFAYLWITQATEIEIQGTESPTDTEPSTDPLPENGLR